MSLQYSLPNLSKLLVTVYPAKLAHPFKKFQIGSSSSTVKEGSSEPGVEVDEDNEEGHLFQLFFPIPEEGEELRL